MMATLSLSIDPYHMFAAEEIKKDSAPDSGLKLSNQMAERHLSCSSEMSNESDISRYLGTSFALQQVPGPFN